ncbi:Npun_F0296 family exosortase-dependent surface protein [Sphingomonas sp. Tas61C01]|uniref:Npun_F0296 family exosortase-dependent surface protein n=1 Tax=Sphingomonas sp. Tas61C01 TaxID=3458297 RepID=UPI00403E4E5E
MFAAPASAATFGFVQMGASPSSGYTVINTFDTAAGLIGAGFAIKVPPADSNGAPPASSIPAGTPYLSVFGGGSATYNFTSLVNSFQFDWGSIDAYNTLTIVSNMGPDIVIPGSASFTNPANGNQSAPATNGLFTVFGGEGEFFKSVTFSSTGNSFEVDNLAIAAVPEPATWAMMLIGFGLIGATARYRRRHNAVTYA